jgi:NADH-quinone oxidoreductase subunit C
MTALDIAQQLQREFGALIASPVEFRGEVSVGVGDAEKMPAVCAFAKEQLGCDYLVDITSIDNHGEDPRFVVVYQLYSYGHRLRLRLKTAVSEEKGELPSVTSVWRAAEWLEREVYDMMGLRFRGHPDLRRILMWDGYPHFPLRKDFPLAGKPTDLPEIAFTQAAPEEGGPFVTVAGGQDSAEREPRVRGPKEPA